MVFSKSVAIRKEVSITLGGVRIKPILQATFLGVVLNQNLQWGPHTQHLVTTASHGLGVALIKLLSGQTWGRPKSHVYLTGSFVRSRHTYDCRALLTNTHAQ